MEFAVTKFELLDQRQSTYANDVPLYVTKVRNSKSSDSCYYDSYCTSNVLVILIFL